MAEIRSRSIERTLPILMSALLLGVVGSLSWIAYRELERALLTSVESRLEGAQRLLSDLLVRSLDARVQALGSLAARPEIVAYLAEPSDSTRAEAVRVLAGAASGSPAVQALELWSPSGECLVATGGARGEAPGDVPGAEGCRADPAAPATDDGVGHLRLEGGSAVFDLVAPVGVLPTTAGESEVPGPSAPGRLVEVRTLSEAEGAALIEGLIGSDAEVLVGSPDGGAWSDLASAVAGPPVDSASGSLVPYRDAAGVPLVGMASALPGTPWLVWVGFPRPVVLAPLEAFLERMGRATLVILLLGAAGAWLVGHRIARPLREVTEAAEAIASGRGYRTVRSPRTDETGRLAAAFNAMGERIEAHNRELEDRVAERTRELRETLGQLQEAQEQLVRREKLAMLGQLASGVGHELRNPLGVMSNAVYYLEMVLEDPREDVGDYLGILRAQIGLSEKIVEDLLDFARIRPPQLEPVTLPELIGDQLARLAAPEGVVVRRELPPDLPSAVVDRVQIGQVVLNLMSNAFQAMEEGGGTLTVTGSMDGPGRVRLDVRDSGAGIPEENLARIFEPLFTTRARGIGLGLAVARSLAEANRGALTVASRPGEGATFTLVLPTFPAEPT